MRNNTPETLSEHSFDVGILAHALAVIGKKRLKKDIDVNRAVILALYHDAGEIITGDMPTPIKYQNQEITNAYKQVERAASDRIFSMLPDDFKEEYNDLFYPQEKDEYLWKIVKAADKLSAYIKCIEEEKSGNTEFIKAKEATMRALEQMELEELRIFMAEFLDTFSRTLDEQ